MRIAFEGGESKHEIDRRGPQQERRNLSATGELYRAFTNHFGRTEGRFCIGEGATGEEEG